MRTDAKKESNLIKKGYTKFGGFSLFIKKDKHGRLLKWVNHLKVSASIVAKPTFAQRCDLGCNKIYTSQEGLQRHRNRVISKRFYKGRRAPYGCKYCPKRYYTMYDQKQHERCCTMKTLCTRRHKLGLASLQLKQA